MAKFLDDMTKPSTLKLFFFIKGSKDYPLDHIVTDRFGFDDENNIETPIFDNSIHNVIQRVKNPRQIENLYSLFSDEQNGIPALNSKASIRDFREKEFISTMIIADGKIESTSPDADNAFVDHVIPNYSNKILDNINELKGIMSAEAVNNIYPGEKVFWQKIFSIAEFFKKYEKNIYTEDVYSEEEIYPIIYSDTLDQNIYYGTVNSDMQTNLKDRLKSETVPGKYLTLFVGNDEKASTLAENNDSYNYNPFRTKELYGADQNSDINEKQKFDDLLWHKRVSNTDITKMLNIKYVPGTCIYSKSEKVNRIAYIQFNLTYHPTSKFANIEKEWIIKLYFDPDAFIRDSGISEFNVYTYNDVDLDNQYPDEFNPLDNDYANTLSTDPNIKGNFIASKSEVETQIMRKLTDTLSTGLYKNYTTFNTDRISPKIIENLEGKHEINWDVRNKTTQTFYIFYNRRSPTSSEAISVVKDYLRKLHSNCKPPTYHDGAKTDLKTIGHTEADKEDFLAKMYPSLFSSIRLHIVPLGHRFCIGGNIDSEYEKNKYNPDAYYNTITMDRVYDTLHSINTFNKFAFNPEGNQNGTTLKDTDKKCYPVEILYTGGIVNTIGSNDEFKFKFPWFCITDDDVLNPLTSKVGFRDYKPKFFKNPTTPATPADKLQIIIIKLTERMFQNTKTSPKNKYKSIAGVLLTYKNSKEIDALSVDYNQVEFILNNVQFLLYAQTGKCFATLNAPADATEEG